MSSIIPLSQNDNSINIMSSTISISQNDKSINIMSSIIPLSRNDKFISISDVNFDKEGNGVYSEEFFYAVLADTKVSEFKEAHCKAREYDPATKKIYFKINRFIADENQTMRELSESGYLVLFLGPSLF